MDKYDWLIVLIVVAILMVGFMGGFVWSKYFNQEYEMGQIEGWLDGYTECLENENLCECREPIGYGVITDTLTNRTYNTSIYLEGEINAK